MTSIPLAHVEGEHDVVGRVCESARGTVELHRGHVVSFRHHPRDAATGTLPIGLRSGEAPRQLVDTGRD